MSEFLAFKRGMKREAGQRPERQLHDVVIEFRGRVLKVMQAIDDQNRDQRARRPDQRPRGRVDQCKCGDDHDFGERVIRGIHAEYSIHDFDQPPRQRRQLVGAEHPFPAVGQCLDQIERQIGIEHRRQRGPDGEVNRQKAPNAASGRRAIHAIRPRRGATSGSAEGAARASGIWLMGIGGGTISPSFTAARRQSYRSTPPLWLRWRCATPRYQALWRVWTPGGRR